MSNEILDSRKPLSCRFCAELVSGSVRGVRKALRLSPASSFGVCLQCGPPPSVLMPESQAEGSGVTPGSVLGDLERLMDFRASLANDLLLLFGGNSLSTILLQIQSAPRPYEW